MMDRMMLVLAGLISVFSFGCNEYKPPVQPASEFLSENNEGDYLGNGKNPIQEVASTTHYGVAQENTEFYFTLQPDEVGVVTFQPWQTGNWKCYAWHTNSMEWASSVGTSYYWRDALNQGDPYHWWANDASGYSFTLRSEEDFYNGSIGITYEIRFNQHTDVPLPMVVWIVED